MKDSTKKIRRIASFNRRFFDLDIGKLNETPEATFSHLPELSDIFALGMGIGIGVKWRLDGRWIGIGL